LLKQRLLTSRSGSISWSSQCLNAPQTVELPEWEGVEPSW
jgi:hypothetical protein